MRKDLFVRMEAYDVFGGRIARLHGKKNGANEGPETSLVLAEESARTSLYLSQCIKR
jgi:hypothetical protein